MLIGGDSRWLGPEGCWERTRRIPWDHAVQRAASRSELVEVVAGVPSHAAVLGLLDRRIAELSPAALESALAAGPTAEPWVPTREIWEASQPRRPMPSGATDLTRLAALGTRPAPVITPRFEAALVAIEAELLRSDVRAVSLTGRAGAGKTTVATALAHRIVNGDIHWRLRDLTVVQIPAAWMAGDGAELAALDATGVVLFMDEVHQLQAAAQRGVNPALDRLKVLVSQGVAVIVASNRSDTVFGGRDEALDRRFTNIIVPEADGPETGTIVALLAANSGVALAAPMVRRIVRSSTGLGRFAQPAAGARLAARALAEADRVGATEVGSPHLSVALEREGLALSGPSDEADWQRVLRVSVAAQDDAVERLAGRLAAELEARELLRQRGSTRPSPPLVFVLIGRVGCGKSVTAEAIAEALGNTTEVPFRWHGGDFSERHHVAKLLGAPPSYVGFDDSGELVAAIARGARVLVFDELSLFHKTARNVIERLVDEGRVTSGAGTELRFDGVVVFTDNADLHADARRAVGFTTADVPETFDPGAWSKRRLGARLASRLGSDTFVVFGEVSSLAARREILRLHVLRLGAELGCQVRSEDEVLDLLAATCDPALGARELVRVVRDAVRPAAISELRLLPEAAAIGLFAEGSDDWFAHAITAEDLSALDAEEGFDD